MQKCIIMTDMPCDVIDFPELITHIQYVQTLPAPTVAMYTGSRGGGRYCMNIFERSPKKGRHSQLQG